MPERAFAGGPDRPWALLRGACVAELEGPRQPRLPNGKKAASRTLRENKEQKPRSEPARRRECSDPPALNAPAQKRRRIGVGGPPSEE